MKHLAKIRPRVWLAGLLLAFGAPAVAAEVAYTLDSTHTQVQFNWNHLGLSNPGASFDNVTGTLLWDAADPTRSSVEVSMPVDSVDTHVPVLDAEFKSAKFFDIGRFPNVTFKSTQVERVGLGNRYTVTGNLTAHGITRPVVLDVVLNGVGQHPMFKAPALGFEATTRFNRSDFGLTVALPMVSNEIRVHITAEAIESKGFEKAMKAMDDAGQQK